MKINGFASVFVGSLFIVSTASAAFTGLFGIAKGTLIGPGTGFWSCNIYACFDSPTDRALSVTGATLNPINASFYQHPLGGATEPNPILFPFFPDLQWDTFVTIGLKQQGPPGTPLTTLEPGSSMTSTDFTGGWFTDGDAPQGLAAALPGLPGFYVLLMQLTIENPPPTAGFMGSMTIAWKTATSGAQFTQVHTGLIHVPAGGALPLLAVAWMAGLRRRR